MNFAKFLRTPFFHRTPSDDCFCTYSNFDVKVTCDLCAADFLSNLISLLFIAVANK